MGGCAWVIWKYHTILYKELEQPQIFGIHRDTHRGQGLGTSPPWIPRNNGILAAHLGKTNPEKNKPEHGKTGYLETEWKQDQEYRGNNICVFLILGTMLVFHRLKI